LAGLFFILSSLINDLSGVGGDDQILESKEGLKGKGRERRQEEGDEEEGRHSERCKRQKSKWLPKKNWGTAREWREGVPKR